MTEGSSGEFSVAPTSSAGAEAKEALVGLLEGEAEPLRARATLLLTELLIVDRSLGTAAGDARIAVKVIPGDGSVRFEVRDDGSGLLLATLRRASKGTHGWSPHLLGRVADRWGLVSDDEGAWIWFELDVPRDGGGSAA